MKKIFSNIFNILFFVVFSYLMFVILGKFNLNNIIISCGAIVYGFFLIFLKKDIYDKSYNKKIYILLFALIIIIQIIMGYFFRTVPSWDFGIVFTEGLNKSWKIVNLGYFCRYPNNIPLAYLFKVILKITRFFKIKNYIYTGMGINMFFINISILFIVLTVKEIFGTKKALFSLVFLMQMPIFYLSVPIFYSDTISMPFTIIPMYFFIKFKKSENKKYKIIYSLLISIFAFLGINIKITTGICFIAIIIYEIFLDKETDLKKFTYQLISVITLICLIFGEALLFKYKCDYVDRIDNERFGFYHYLMMSMSTQGGFYTRDVEYTASFKTKEEKKEADIARLKEKMQNFNTPKKFLKLVTSKQVQLWGVGTFYIPQLLYEGRIRKGVIQSLVYGDKRAGFMYFSQVQRILMIVLIWLSIFYRDKSYLNKSINTILRLATLGFIIFFTFWEVAPRYIIHFLPIFIVLQIFGLETCEQIFSDLKNIDISKLKSLNFNKKE